jgi:hypothetical protein
VEALHPGTRRRGREDRERTHGIGDVRLLDLALSRLISIEEVSAHPHAYSPAAPSSTNTRKVRRRDVVSSTIITSKE